MKQPGRHIVGFDRRRQELRLINGPSTENKPLLMPQRESDLSRKRHDYSDTRLADCDQAGKGAADVNGPPLIRHPLERW